MNKSKTPWAVLAATFLLVATAPVMARGGGYGNGPYGGQQWTAQQQQDFATYRAERVQARLNYENRQLGITAAQQAAWDNYAQTAKQYAEQMGPANMPPANADQSTIMKYRSERAAQHAQALANMSQATAKLEATLTPEQKTQFNAMGGPGRGPGAGGYARRGGGYGGGHHGGRGGGYGMGGGGACW